MDITHFECPRCGIPLALTYDDDWSETLNFDPLKWHESCQDQEAKRRPDGPSLCVYAREAMQGFFPRRRNS
jgi:hypothetical protein